MSEYITLFDVLPKIENKQEIVQEVESVKEYLQESGRTYCSPDEAIFLATLERHIKMFEKAKKMVRDSKFTVLYRGAEFNDRPSITDFEIIPIQVAKKDAPST